MERFNFTVFKRFWAIAHPYWQSEEKWQARGFLLLVVLLSLVYAGLSVILNNQRGAMISALSAQDQTRFWHTILIFTAILAAYAPQYAGYIYLRDQLGLQWRRWLTHRYVHNYFQNQAYYHLNQIGSEIDNPDQRITEDVKSFTQESLTFLLVIVDSLLAMIAFSGVLWVISATLVWFLILYALLGTLLTVGVFGQPLVRLNFEQLKKEADFRFSLVRVRENTEAIAFYRGEEREAEQVNLRFMAAFENFKRLIFWELNLNVITNAYEFLPFILPAIVVAPGIFAGDLEIGKVTEAQGAFIRIFFSLNLIVARFQELTTFGAGIDRLYTFAQRLEPPAADPSQTPEQPTIARETAAELTLADLTVQTPNHQRILVQDLSVTVPPGQGLLIRGPSGCGKSSLLRAIAGLWTAGTGKILRPPADQILFLPQRPYMILGPLRDQMLYPNPALEVDDQQLREVLQQVNLLQLEKRFGGFDAEQDWAAVLSLGEQQRLTFARLILNRPAYVILDEATSALDLENEATLYNLLLNQGMTFLSVGHRSTLPAYHQLVLELCDDQTWQLSAHDVEIENGKSESKLAMVTGNLSYGTNNHPVPL
jgi:putative ATP-binding cassette transporter